MSTLLISRAAREAVKALLAEQFNGLVAFGCDAFDIGTQAFRIDYEQPGDTFFEAPYTFDTLKQYVKADPAGVQCLYTTSAVDEHDQFPTTFSGPVEIHIDTHLAWECADNTRVADMETLCDAVEAALTQLLQAVNPRKGTLIFERTEPQFETDIWYRSVLCSAEIEVTV